MRNYNSGCVSQTRFFLSAPLLYSAKVLQLIQVLSLLFKAVAIVCMKLNKTKYLYIFWLFPRLTLENEKVLHWAYWHLQTHIRHIGSQARGHFNQDCKQQWTSSFKTFSQVSDSRIQNSVRRDQSMSDNSTSKNFKLKLNNVWLTCTWYRVLAFKQLRF